MVALTDLVGVKVVVALTLLVEVLVDDGEIEVAGDTEVLRVADTVTATVRLTLELRVEEAVCVLKGLMAGDLLTLAVTLPLLVLVQDARNEGDEEYRYRAEPNARSTYERLEPI